MNYILDAHAIIWLFEDSSKMSAAIKELIKQTEIRIYISTITLWEIALKLNIGKLTLKISFDELLSNIKNGDFEIIQIEDAYLRVLNELQFIHKDPFDRLLIASAIAEGLTIITADANIQKYDVPWIW
ncbi:MAG: type II toxin-antitoxin system VapC family toxin [Oscillospiraceae bacterium]|nr:type II toxin-antitoxin system VapC family toxin [Oscillospiraceae bacterium]